MYDLPLQAIIILSNEHWLPFKYIYTIIEKSLSLGMYNVFFLLSFLFDFTWYRWIHIHD